MNVTAKATRSGDWWAIEVPEVPGVFTQAKRLDQVADMTADAIATMMDIDAADVEVSVEPDLSDEVLAAAVADALGAAAQAQQAQAAASGQMRAAVSLLRRNKFTSRDVAAMLKVSHQRVSQLEKSAS